MIGRIKTIFQDRESAPRPEKPFSFDQMRTICYVLNEPNDATTRALESLQKNFPKTDARVLVSYGDLEVPRITLPQIDFDSKSFDWRMRIKDVNLQEALEKEFDLCVLYCDTYNPLVLQVIRKISARYMVAKIKHERADISIETEKNNFTQFNSKLMNLLPLIQTR